MGSAKATAISWAIAASCFLVGSCSGDKWDNCHYDCFGYTLCANGEVIEAQGYPVPCNEWDGECPYSPGVVYRCEKGCNGGGWRDYPPDGIECEEDRPKSAGDPCVDYSDCIPMAIVGQTDRVLDCDTNLGVCVEVPNPCWNCYDHGTCTTNPDFTADCVCSKCYHDDGTANCLPYPAGDLSCYVVDSDESITGVWTASGNDVWAVSREGTILSWNGATWLSTSVDPSEVLFGVWGFAPDDVWAYGSLIEHFDGDNWTESSSENISGLWGASSNEIWAVWAYYIRKWDGQEWNSINSPNNIWLKDLWGVSADDIWAIGKDGVTAHWNGIDWSIVPSNVSAVLNRVWGSGSDDFWAVGDDGTVIHWSGGTWTQVDLGTTENLNGIWGSSPSDIWIVGDRGTILHWDGAIWSNIESHTNESLWAVSGFGDDVWIVGKTGTILRKKP